MCDLYVLAAHLLVAHCVAGDSRSIDMRSSRAPCTCRVMLGISISVPCLSQSHRTSPPKLASQHAVADDDCPDDYCKTCPDFARAVLVHWSHCIEGSARIKLVVQT